VAVRRFRPGGVRRLPVAARLHLAAFLLLRLLAGFAAGAVFPATHALTARWSTPGNRSVVVAITTVGGVAGMAAGMLASGVRGWPSVFYVFGAVGCLWSAAWFVVGDSSPSTHPRISRSELRYWELESGMMQLVVRPPTPWRKLLTSLPVWALAVAFFAADRGLFTLVGWVPLFMHDVLGFDMTSCRPFRSSRRF